MPFRSHRGRVEEMSPSSSGGAVKSNSDVSVAAADVSSLWVEEMESVNSVM